MASLTAAGTTNFNFNVTSATVSDAISVTGNLNLTGSTNNLSLSFPNLVFPNAPVAATYNIVNYGTETAPGSTFTVTGPVRLLYSVSATNQPGSYVLTTTVNSATWNGSSGTAWDNSSANWTGPSGSTFATGQPAIFNDSANTTVVLNPAGGNSNPITPYSTTFNNDTSTTYTLSNFGGYTSGIAGTGGVIVNGTGTVNFNSPNTYSGGTYLNGGILAITANSALGNAPGIAATNLTFNGGTLAFNGSGITLGSTRSVSILAGGATFNLDGNNATVAGSISGTAGGNLTVTGSTGNTLLLSSATNTYNGNTIVAGGTLQTVAGGLPTTTTLMVGGAGGTPTFDLHAINQTVAGLSDNGSFTNGTVTDSSTAATLTLVPPTATSNTFTGVIQNGSTSDTVSLTLNGTGTGTQVLAGANTFTGPTTVLGGTFDLANQNALQNSTLTMAGGSVTFDQAVGGNAFTVGGLSGTGLSLQNNALSPAPITLTVGSSVTNASTAFSGLSGSGSLVKAGTGTLSLSGTSTYLGSTTISAGTLALVPASQVTIGNANFTIGTTTGNFAYAPNAVTGVSWTFSAGAWSRGHRQRLQCHWLSERIRRIHARRPNDLAVPHVSNCRRLLALVLVGRPQFRGRRQSVLRRAKRRDRHEFRRRGPDHPDQHAL